MYLCLRGWDCDLRTARVLIADIKMPCLMFRRSSRSTANSELQGGPDWGGAIRLFYNTTSYMQLATCDIET